MVELEDFRKLKVYTHVLRSHQRGTGGKIIGVRCVDVNQGDDNENHYRSRLVGKEFKTKTGDSLQRRRDHAEAQR